MQKLTNIFETFIKYLRNVEDNADKSLSNMIYKQCEYNISIMKTFISRILWSYINKNNLIHEVYCNTVVQKVTNLSKPFVKYSFNVKYINDKSLFIMISNPCEYNFLILRCLCLDKYITLIAI